MIDKLNPANNATLLWFPKGETPTKDDFNPAKERRAEPWWFAHEAFVDAVSAIAWGHHPEHSPWILFRDSIYDEAAIRLEWTKLQDLMRR